MKNHLFAGAMATALLVCVLPPAAIAQSGTAGLAIAPAGYVQISTQRVDRDDFSYTYTAVLNNTGAARSGVTATVTSLASNVTIVPGQGTLEFSPVPAGSFSAPGQVTSSNTFTIIVNRTVPFDFSSLSWSFNNPFANPGPNQTVPNQSTVTLNGSGSTNPSGIGSLTYSWAFQSVPAGSAATLSNANNVIATFVPDVIGTYVVALTVSNGSQSDTNTVTISTTDVPPTANAGPNQTVSVGSVVALDGTKSSDVNGQPLTYFWTLITAPNGSAAAISAPRSPTPTFIADVAGTYVVGLVVNDGTLSSTQATVTITTGNTPPVAVPTATPQVVNVNGLVQLSGANSTDVDGNPLTFQWTLNTSQAPGSKATLSSATIVNPTFTADVPGTYVAQLIVFDGTIASKPVTVMITTNSVVAPTANAGTNQMIVVGSTVQLQGSGTDPQGLPLTFSWTLTTVPTGSAAVLSNATIQDPTFVADLPGTYAAQLIVSNGFLFSPAATVTITSTSTPPIAVPTTSTPSVLVGAIAQLSGASSTDPDGVPITGYSWSLSVPNGSRATLTGANAEFATFVPDVAGTYVAQLIVKDKFASSNPATVSITAGQMTLVLTPNPLNLTNAQQALTITISPGTGPSPLSVSLSGFDPTVISVSPTTVTIPANSTSANATVTPVGSGSTSILANADGYQPATVTVNVTTPTISIAFNNNVTSVGLTHTVGGTITLSAPAPPNGANVTLASINDTDAGQIPGAITFNPTMVVIPAGQTTGTFTVTGTALGNVGILPGAAGYARVNVVPFSVVILGNVSIPATTSVSPGQSVALNVQLSSPAPADGATVQLQSSNTAVATVPASVTILPGATTPAVAPQVTGVGLGSTTITVSSGGYNGGTGAVNVNATLSFTPQTLSLAPNASQNVTVNLSGPAPAAGLTVNLASDNTSAATVPASVTILGGLQTATVQVTGGSAGTAHITASVNNQFVSTAGATLTVTVTSSPVITCPTTTSGEVGLPFTSGPLTVTSGTAPFTFTVATGSLNGLVLNASTGAISGTPTAAGSFTIQVKDASGATGTSCPFTISTALTLPCPPTTTITVGVAFTSQVTAAGGTAPFTYSLATGSLNGLILNASTGAISGTPTSAGSFSIKVTDANGATATSCTFTISGVVTLPCPTVTTGEVGVSFTSQLSASGGATPYTYSLATGSLNGLTLNASTGAITGTPTSAGSFTIQVKDANGATATSCTFTINGVLSLPCPATTTGEVGVAFTGQLSAAGGVGPFTYTLATGSLNGLILNASTGAITGTPTAAGTFTIQVKDANGATATSCTFTILSALTLPCPTTTTASVGASFTAQLSAAGGATPYTYSLATGSLNGLILNASTGAITGTPTSAGSFAIQVKDANGATATSCTFTISGAVTLPCPTVTTGEVGVSFTSQLSASGGTTPYTYSLATGSLNGLILNASTGAITGTPTAAGTFTIQVKDANGATATSCTFTINGVLSLPCPATITGEVGVAFTGQLSAAGGVGPFTYTLATGSLNGLILNASTGAITGTPTTAGTFTIQVKDANGATATSCTFTISSALTLPCPAVTTAEVGVSFTGQLSASGGTLPYTYSLATGSLNGLILNASSGAITGTPTAAGTFTIQVKDANGATAASCTFTIKAVLLLPCPTTTTGDANVAFSSQLSATGGVMPYTYSVATGSLNGLILNASSGAITGTPTAAGTFTIQVKDANGATATSCTFTISSALTLPCPTTTTGSVGTTFSGQLAAAGGAMPYTYSLATGSLSGLILNASTGAITGTPTTAGNFTIQVKDANGATATSCTFTISGVLTLPCPSNITAEVGVSFTSLLSAAGGTGTYTYSLATGSLNGLILNASTGAITGTPTSAGSFTIQVKDAGGATATSCTFTINGALSLPCPANITAEANVAFSSQLSPAGGVGPFTYTVATGSLSGLTLNPSTGAITGTATSAGSFSIKVTDADGATATSCTFTINAALSLPCPANVTGEVNVPFSSQLSATFGIAPYTYSMTGTVPNGLTVSSMGLISGTPTQTGRFVVLVTDAAGATATSCSFTINTGLSLPCPANITGEVSAPFSSQLSAGNGVPPYTYTVATGSLSGLVLNASSGVITGTPNAAGNFTIKVTDAVGATATSCVFTISTGVTLPCPAVTSGEVGVPFSSQLTAGNGVPPYAYTMVGSLSGLVVNPTSGAITGTPTAAGTFTVKVTDANGASATSCTFTIVSHVTMTCPSTLTGMVNNPFSATPTVSGGVTPYSFSVSSGTLPNGLTLNTTTGAITGTPTVQGGFTLQVTDADTAVAATTCTFTITKPTLQITTTSLPSGVQNAAYSATVMVTGGTAPYTFAAGSPFPTWLTINPSTGVISGTPNRGIGTFPVQVQVTDTSNPTQVATMLYSLLITNPSFAFATTSPLPSAQSGVPYVQPILVLGGNPPYNYQVVASTLPSWLTFDATGAACQNNGTPTLCGIPPNNVEQDTIIITASDSSNPPVQLSMPFVLNVLNCTPGTGCDAISITGGSGSSSSFAVGQNLQVPMTVAFSPALTSALNLTITSSNPGVVTFSKTQSSAVSNTFAVTVPAGTPAFIVYVQGVTPGSTTITVSAPPYTNGTATVTVGNSGFVLLGPSGVGGSFSSSEGVTTGLTVAAALLDSSGLFVETEQVASSQTCQTVNMVQVCTPIITSVPITVAPSTLGTLSAGPLSFQGGISSVPVNFKASSTNTGTGTVTITEPSGFTTPATGTFVNFQVTQSGLIPPPLTVGSDLQVQTAIAINGSTTSASTITLQSSNASKLLFSNTETGIGAGSITLTVPAGASQSGNFWVRAYGAPGSVGYTATSTAFGMANGSVTIGPTGLVISTPGGANAPFSITSGSSFANLTIQTALLNGSGIPVQLQELAADQSISVTVTSSNPSVGTISSSPITIAGASTGASTTFVPVATGTSTITAVAPNGFLPSNDPAQSASVIATVTTCTLAVNNGLTVGQFLEAQGQVILSCAAGSGGTAVTLKSNSPFLQLAVNPTDAGSNSITVTVPAGGHIGSYWVYGLGTGLTTGEGASPQTVTYSANTTANGSGTDTVTLAPSAILIAGPSNQFVSFNASIASGAQAITVVTDVLTNDGTNTPTNDGFGQPLAGNKPLLVTIANSNSSAGSLSPTTVSITPGNFTGTATFTPTSPGNTTISVTQPAGWIGTVGNFSGSDLTKVTVTVTP